MALLSGIVCTIAQKTLITTATIDKVGAVFFNLALDSRSQLAAMAKIMIDLNEVNFHADEIEA